MKDGNYTLHDIDEEIIKSADLYLRTAILNQKRMYFRRITKISKYGITMLELEKYQSNLVYYDSYFDNFETTYFYYKEKCISITNPEIADALNELSKNRLHVILLYFGLKMTIEQVANELGLTKRMVYIHKRKALDELRKKLKNYEE